MGPRRPIRRFQRSFYATFWPNARPISQNGAAPIRQKHDVGEYGALDPYRPGFDTSGKIAKNRAGPLARQVSMGPWRKIGTDRPRGVTQ